MPDQPSSLPPTAETSPESEGRFHAYSSNDIPWYVRAIWIGFWIFAVTYTIRFLLPAMQLELLGK